MLCLVCRTDALIDFDKDNLRCKKCLAYEPKTNIFKGLSNIKIVKQVPLINKEIEQLKLFDGKDHITYH